MRTWRSYASTKAATSHTRAISNLLKAIVGCMRVISCFVALQQAQRPFRRQQPPQWNRKWCPRNQHELAISMGIMKFEHWLAREGTTFRSLLARQQDSQENKFVIPENLVIELTFTSILSRSRSRLLPGKGINKKMPRSRSSCQVFVSCQKSRS